MAADDKAARGDSEPLGDIKYGWLLFTTSVAQLVIASATAPGNLYESRTDFRTNRSSNAGRVRSGYRNYSVIDMFRSWRPPRARLDLNLAIPWEIELRSTAADFRAKWTALNLRRLTIAGAIEDAQIDLAKPVGTVPIRCDGGATKLIIERPAGVVIRMQVCGKVAGLTLDGQTLVPSFWKHSWTTADYEQATNKYDIAIRGDATDVAIGTIEPDE